jgi:hypothetical protein
MALSFSSRFKVMKLTDSFAPLVGLFLGLLFLAGVRAQELVDPFADVVADPADDKAPVAPDTPIERFGPEQALYRIQSALLDETEFDFVELPLRDVVEYLSDLHKVQIKFDIKALDDAGLGTDLPITKSTNGVRLGAALNRLLGAVELTYAIEDEVLLITTASAAEQRPVVKLYPLQKLLAAGWSSETVRRVIGMESKGESELLGSYLAISQSQPAHRRTARLFETLYAAAAGAPAADAKGPGEFAVAQIERALQQKTMFDFTEAPLAADVCNYLGDLHHVRIEIDVKSLDDAGLGSDIPITHRVAQVTLASGLNRLLGEIGMTYLIEDELLLLTTAAAAEARPRVELYPLQSLVDSGWSMENLRRVIQMQTKTEGELLGSHLAICQSQPAHRRTARLMADLRAAAQGEQ